MQVYMVHRLQLGDFSEIVVIGEEFRIQVAREADQFGVNIALVRKIPIVDFHFVLLVTLNTIENLEASAAARLMGSLESAICCSSRSTKRGTTTRPSRKLASTRSAIRPSIMTLVSSSSRLSGLFWGAKRT